MARASVSLSLEEGRWLLHLPARPCGGGGGGTSAPSVLPLRQKPPVPADGIEITELDSPENGNGAVLPGIDSHGNLIPWFGDGGAEAPAAEEQHSALGSAGPGAAEVGPAAAGAGAGASAAAAAAAHRSAAQTDDTRQSQAAALDATRVAVAAQAAAAVEAAIADALAAPPRKRLRQAMEDGNRGSHDRSVSPSAAAAAAGGFAVGSVPGAAAVSDQTTLSAGGGGGTPPLEAAVEAGGLSGSGAGGGSLFADGEDDEEEGEEATQAEKFDTQCVCSEVELEGASRGCAAASLQPPSLQLCSDASDAATVASRDSQPWFWSCWFRLLALPSADPMGTGVLLPSSFFCLSGARHTHMLLPWPHAAGVRCATTAAACSRVTGPACAASTQMPGGWVAAWLGVHQGVGVLLSPALV